jgi:hypothetical protein
MKNKEFDKKVIKLLCNLVYLKRSMLEADKVINKLINNNIKNKNHSYAEFFNSDIKIKKMNNHLFRINDFSIKIKSIESILSFFFNNSYLTKFDLYNYDFVYDCIYGSEIQGRYFNEIKIYNTKKIESMIFKNEFEEINFIYNEVITICNDYSLSCSEVISSCRKMMIEIENHIFNSEYRHLCDKVIDLYYKLSDCYLYDKLNDHSLIIKSSIVFNGRVPRIKECVIFLINENQENRFDLFFYDKNKE